MADDREDRFGSDVDPAQFSQCLGCARWQGDAQCEAFEGQIPTEILVNEFDHRTAHPDDNGLRYEAEAPDISHPVDVQRTTRPT